MPTLNAMDYSWARPDVHQLAAAGITVVARYLFDGGKGLTDGERRTLHAVGIGVVLNYEANAGNHLLGASQGHVDGRNARALAAELGVPAGTPIYYSCDREVSGSQMPTVLAYLRAADSAQHPARAYAQRSVLDAYGRPGWQTVAWSGGQVSAHAVLYQYRINQLFHGSQVDYDQVLNASALGAWWPANSPHAPQEEFTMDAEVQARFDKIDNRLTSLFAVDTNNDGKTDITGTVQAAVRAELARMLNPASLAAQIAAKMPAGAADVAAITAALKTVIDGTTLEVH